MDEISFKWFVKSWQLTLKLDSDRTWDCLRTDDDLDMENDNFDYDNYDENDNTGDDEVYNSETTSSFDASKIKLKRPPPGSNIANMTKLIEGQVKAIPHLPETRNDFCNTKVEFGGNSNLVVQKSIRFKED